MKQGRLTRLGVAVVAVEAMVAAMIVFVLLGTVFGAVPSPLPTPVEPVSLGVATAPTATAVAPTQALAEAPEPPVEAPAAEETPGAEGTKGAAEEGLQEQVPNQEPATEPAPTVVLAERVAMPTADLGQAEQGGTPGPVTHLVQDGENLFRISLAYGVSLESIMSANGLTDPRLIYAGQILAIPMAEAIAPPALPMSPLRAATEEPVAPDLMPTSPPLQLQPTATSLAEPSPAPAEPTAQAVGGAADLPTPEPPPQTDLASLPPLPPAVNGVPNDLFVVLPPAVVAHIRDIYARGQALGLNPRAFSKVGDSTIENPFFLARFDGGTYNLGDYAALQAAIDYYAGSFGRQGIAVRRGFHSWTVTDPMWADKSVCLANESPVACEIRLHRPAILLIRLGSNDVGVPAYFESNMRQVVELAIERGVIPVLGTKADRHEGGPNINNDILRRIAADYQIPVWDFDLVAATIPGRGLDSDGVHLTTFYAHDYTSPDAFRRGHSVHNLTALVTLDAIWKALEAEN